MIVMEAYNEANEDIKVKLSSKMSEIVNHFDKKQCQEFKELFSHNPIEHIKMCLSIIQTIGIDEIDMVVTTLEDLSIDLTFDDVLLLGELADQ